MLRARRARRALATAAALGLACLAPGCLLSIDESELDRDASTADAQGDVTADGLAPGPDAAEAGEPACPTGMVRVPSPDGASFFCIDATEVTNLAYRAFVAAVDPPASGSQIAACSWNDTYRPGGGFGPDDAAIGGVDWCDAYAYCAWAGKRLCGAIGGGPSSFDAYPGAPSTGQWYNACSRGGTLAFPYGNQYEPTWCNGAPLGAAGPVAVGSLPQCIGGYPGLYDMSGNVSEFLDSCSSTPEPSCGSGDDCDLCLLVGGGFLSGGDGGFNIACTYANEVYRKSQYVDNGLRCCADLP